MDYEERLAEAAEVAEREAALITVDPARTGPPPVPWAGPIWREEHRILGSALSAMRDREIDGGVVIRAETPYNHYLLFRNWDDFYYYQEQQPVGARCFHEVLTTDARCLYVDVDNSKMPEADHARFMQYLLCAWRHAAGAVFGPGIAELDEVVIISACGYSKALGRTKFSVHIRCPRYVATCDDLKVFCNVFVKRLVIDTGDSSYYDYMTTGSGNPEESGDEGVYSRNHCMRVLGSTKAGDDRHSRIIYTGAQQPMSHKAAFRASRITPAAHYSCELVRAGPLYRAPKKAGKEGAVNDGMVSTILAKTAEHWAGHAYVRHNGAFINFVRTGPAACPICCRVHGGTGHLYFVVRGDAVYMKCFRAPAGASRRVLGVPGKGKGKGKGKK